MAKVEVEIEEDVATNDNGNDVPCVRATCGRCGHEVMSYGTSNASRRRCLAVLHEECPNGERNYYVDIDGDSENA